MPLNQLVPELTGLLGSTDGERRDDLALNFLETWIYKRMIAPEDVRPIVPIVLANVGRGLGSVITIPSCADPSRR